MRGRGLGMCAFKIVLLPMGLSNATRHLKDPHRPVDNRRDRSRRGAEVVRPHSVEDMEVFMKRLVVLFTLAFAVLTAGSALAQSQLGLRAVGGSLAFVNAEDLDGAVGLGVFADLGMVTPNIGLEPVLEYWSKSEEAFGAKASVRDVALGCRGKYYFETSNPKIRPYAGAGLGLHFLKAETSVEMPGFPAMNSEASDTKLGLDLGGGLSTPLGPKNDLRFEMWYGIVSDVSQLALRVGVSHKLGM